MKIVSKKYCYLILVFLFYSCTSSKLIFKKFDEKENINTNYWVTYKQSKNAEHLLASVNDIQTVEKSKTEDLSIGYHLDSIEIIQKTKILYKEINLITDTSKNINNNSKEKDHRKIKETEPRSLISFISSILGFIPTVFSIVFFSFGLLSLGLIGFISAIILGTSGEKKIKENPKKYKGKEFAKIGKKLGWIGVYLAITALFILLLIYLFLLLLFSI